MKTFFVVDREIPADATRAAAILEQALRNADRIQAKTPKAAAKLHYLRARQERHRIGRGHRNPPERTAQVKVVEKQPLGKVGRREITRFLLGQRRRDGILTHYEDLNVVALNGA
jgi:hypothetical protein